MKRLDLEQISCTAQLIPLPNLLQSPSSSWFLSSLPPSILQLHTEMHFSSPPGHCTSLSPFAFKSFMILYPSYDLICNCGCWPHKHFESIRNNQNAKKFVNGPESVEGGNKRLVTTSIVVYLALVDMKTSNNNERSMKGLEFRHVVTMWEKMCD